jgi:hypothetical protein
MTETTTRDQADGYLEWCPHCNNSEVQTGFLRGQSRALMAQAYPYPNLIRQ